jgi:hypothetical protein
LSVNAAHLHLAINHLPVVLVPVGLALLAFAVLRKSEDLMAAGLSVLVLSAATGAGVYLTGAPAEEVVGQLPGVSHEVIETHEEAAVLAAVATGLAGLLALVVLVARRGRQPLPGWMLLATLATAALAAILLARAANLGGYIRHSEIADTRAIVDGLAIPF